MDPICSGGGTGSWDLNTAANEIQAGSYALMDTAYARLGLPFAKPLTVLATVISVNRHGWAVADCGLKALGMDHGDPAMVDGYRSGTAPTSTSSSRRRRVATFPPSAIASSVLPAHVDPTVAYHEAAWVIDGPAIVDRWAIDLRGW